MKKLFIIYLILFLGCISISFTQTAKAADNSSIFNSSAGNYQQLAPLTDPNGNKVDTSNFPGYLQAIYRIGIGMCFVLGVVMFTWAGIEYIISESMGGKSDAKKKITSALTGLAIALISYILLYTINPDLLEFNSIDVTSSATTK